MQGKEKQIENHPISSTFTPYLYILPSLFLFGVFVFYPFIKTIFLGFNMTDNTGNAIKWIGFDNYTKLFGSKDFWFSLKITLQYAVIVVIGSIIMGVLCAIIANEKFRGRALVRTFFAMPMAVSSACIAVIATFILNPTMGLLNTVLGLDIKWLKSIHYALPSVAIVTIWMNIGLNFIFSIAALQNVDPSLYEAGEIAGTNFFQKHWYITLPSISPMLFFLLIINTLNSFQAFAQIRLMTMGGPGKFTQVIIYLIYREAFDYGRYGSAASMSVVLFLIMFVFTAIQFKVEKKVTY